MSIIQKFDRNVQHLDSVIAKCYSDAIEKRNEMNDFYLLVCVLLGFVVYFIYNGLTAKGKLRRRLCAKFGRAPSGDYQSTAIPLFWQAYSAAHPSVKNVDAVTWNDLAMDDVFAHINACESTIGQDYLYAMLHVTNVSATELEQRERLMAAFSDTETRL